MLRIEVYKEKGAVFEIKTVSSRHIKIGRGKFSDILLPDPRISRDELVFERQTDGTYSVLHKGNLRHFQQHFEIELFDYRIVVQALDHVSDEHTKDIAPMPKAGEVKNSELALWFAIFLGLNTFEYLVYENWSKDNLKVSVDLLSAFMILVPFTLVMSVIARAVEGTYHFRKILLLSLKGSVGVFFVANNLMGLRWILGSWLWREQVYLIFLVVLVAYFFWHLGVVVFSHIPKKIRVAILTLLVLLYAVPQVFRYLPYRNAYQYLSMHASPPLIQVFESKAVNQQEFIKKIESL